MLERAAHRSARPIPRSGRRARRSRAASGLRRSAVAGSRARDRSGRADARSAALPINPRCERWMVRIMVLVVVVVSGPGCAGALGPVRVNARCVLLAVERGAIHREGKAAVSYRTLAPAPVGRAHVLARLPPGHPAVEERVGDRRRPPVAGAGRSRCEVFPHPAHREPRSMAADAAASRRITDVGQSSSDTRRMLHPRRAAVVALQATLRRTAPGVPLARRPLRRRRCRWCALSPTAADACGLDAELRRG